MTTPIFPIELSPSYKLSYNYPESLSSKRVMASVVVDSGRSFLNETREIAFEYVNLCYSSEASTEPKMGQEARSPASGRRVAPDSDTVAGGPPPPTTGTAAFNVSLCNCVVTTNLSSLSPVDSTTTQDDRR